MKDLLFESKIETDKSDSFFRPIDNYNFLSQIIRIGKLLASEWDVLNILNKIVTAFQEILPAHKTDIMLFRNSQVLSVQSLNDSIPEKRKNHWSPIYSIILDKVRTHKRPFYISQYHKDEIIEVKTLPIEPLNISMIHFPLIFNNDIIGTVYFDHYQENLKLDPAVFRMINDLTEIISLVAWQLIDLIISGLDTQPLENELRHKFQFNSIIGSHPRIVEILKLIALIADTNATVLIQGESGTGKELVARALHDNSRRKNKPFIPINCGALPQNLLESELFGHSRGAFTGADRDKQGWFESADGGTIFLDEVHEMSSALQVEFLRVLQTGQYNRVGSTEIRNCNVRILAAVTKDLGDLVKQGKFREELFYRLNVIDLPIPPLRERRCDIPLLCQHFLHIFRTKYSKKYLHLSAPAEAFLITYDFPGNVRELENIIERAVLVAERNIIELRHFPKNILNHEQRIGKSTEISNFKLAKQHVVENFEKEYLTDCLKAAHGNLSQAAKIADLHVTNLHAKIKKYHINPNVYKL